MLSDKIFEAHCAQILSCFGLKVGVWLIVWPIFLGFLLTSMVFSIAFQIQFGLPHPSIPSILMRVHTSHRPYGYPPLMLCSWQRSHMNLWCNSWHLCYYYARCWFPCGVRTITCVSFKHVQLFLSMNQHCAHQRWHSHFSRHCHCQPKTSRFTFLILCHPRICCF